MNFLDETAHRYRTDTVFYNAVTALEVIARENGFTPYELRQIAFAAAVRIEETTNRIFKVEK